VSWHLHIALLSMLTPQLLLRYYHPLLPVLTPQGRILLSPCAALFAWPQKDQHQQHCPQQCQQQQQQQQQ
jgi:hypothetical protein